MYLEDVKDGRRFLEVARKAVEKKPVLIIKGGRTPEGARATASHTASMAVEDVVFEGALRQAGVLRMTGVDDFVRTLKGFLNMPLPRGGRLAFVTYSGAQAIMSIDTTVEQGLQVAHLNESTREKISRVIATDSKTKNPVDLFPDWLAHGFEKTTTEILKALLEDDGVDGIIFISFAEARAEIYRPAAELLRGNRPKPVFFSLLGAKKDIDICQSLLEEYQLPSYDFPEYAVRVFAHMWNYAQKKNRVSG
jgi:acetyltransferase